MWFFHGNTRPTSTWLSRMLMFCNMSHFLFSGFYDWCLFHTIKTLLYNVKGLCKISRIKGKCTVNCLLLFYVILILWTLCNIWLGLCAWQSWKGSSHGVSYSTNLALRKPQETRTVKTSTQLSHAFSHPTKYFSNIKDNTQQEIKCLLVCSVITDTTFVLWWVYLHYRNQQWL